MRKISANRRNAQLSTGPKTALGKAKSALNAVKHGIFTKECSKNISDEEARDFEVLRQCLLEIDKSQKILQYECMSNKDLHRHDLTDEQWSVLAPILPGQKGQWGGVAKDNRLFMNSVLWILRTGAPWRDLPKEFGKWGSVHQRFRRWRDSGVWERILSTLAKRPDFEWLMIDASHCKVHPHASGAIGGNEGMGRTKGAMKNSFGRGCAWYADPSHCY